MQQHGHLANGRLVLSGLRILPGLLKPPWSAQTPWFAHTPLSRTVLQSARRIRSWEQLLCRHKLRILAVRGLLKLFMLSICVYFTFAGS